MNPKKIAMISIITPKVDSIKIPPKKAKKTVIIPNRPPNKKAPAIEPKVAIIGIAQKRNEKPEVGVKVLIIEENALKISVSGFTPICIHNPLKNPNPNTNS